jgi:uncharacterized protein YqfA (UPF0365 family)
VRASHAALLKELDDLQKRFAGIDPDEARKLFEQKQLAAGEVEKVIQNRVRSAKAEIERQYAGVAAERDALNGRLTEIQIDQGVTAVATRKGLRPTAIPDITARARNVFKLVNGMPTGFEADGQTVRVGKDGLTPMSLEEWVDQ